MFSATRILTVCALVCAAVAATTSPTRSVIVKKNLAELAKEADAIVVARVRGNAAAWDQPHKLIWTTTRLDVAAVWKGKVGDSLELRELGGTVGDRTLRVPGMPSYRPGERVLVFLRRDAAGKWRTLGLHQGRHSLVAGPSGKGEFVAVPPGHAHVFKGQLPAVPAAQRSRPTLEQLHARVLALVAAPAVKKGGK